MSRGPTGVVLLLLLLGTACGGGAEDDPAGAIAEFDSSVGAGFGPRARLNMELVLLPEASRHAALEHLEADDPDVRIAAVYALSVTVKPEDADALAPILESADPGERVLAAAALLAIEDARAVPILIESLTHDEAIPFGSPPARVWQKARFALLQFTGQDFGLREAKSAAEAAAVVPQWESWWTDSEATFEVIRAPDRFGQ